MNVFFYSILKSIQYLFRDFVTFEHKRSCFITQKHLLKHYQLNVIFLYLLNIQIQLGVVKF